MPLIMTYFNLSETKQSIVGYRCISAIWFETDIINNASLEAIIPDPYKDQSTPVHTCQCLVGKNGLDFVYFFACIWHVLYLFYELYTLIIGKIVKTDNKNLLFFYQNYQN